MRLALTFFFLSAYALLPGKGQTQTAAQPSPRPSPSPVVVVVPTKMPDKIPKTSPQEENKPAPVIAGGGLEILSDTMGVDFQPYLQKLRQAVQQHWYSLMPDEARPPQKKSGKAVLKFSILRNGTLAGTKVEVSSGDMGLDRAAYGAIIYSSPLPELPSNFRGDYLMIRATFLYNPTKEQAKSVKQQENKTVQPPDKPDVNPPKAQEHW